MKVSEIKKLASRAVVSENPVFRLSLGMCPTLAVTVSAINGFAMGAATLVILTLSGIVISALRKVIPGNVRLPGYIMIIATLTTAIQLLMRRFLPELHDALGIYLPLIAVNCIVFFRAESFAAKNNVLDSGIDGLFAGIGFTLALVVLGTVRELLGTGEVFGVTILGSWFPHFTIALLPAGGFMVLALLMALFNFLYNKAEGKKQAAAGTDKSVPASAEAE